VAPAKKPRWRQVLVIVGVAVLVLWAGGGLAAMHAINNYMFGRADPGEATAYPQYVDYAEYPREAVEFPSGDNTLRGHVYGAANTGGLVVIAHGIGGWAEHYITETAWFVDHGYQVFAYDATGSNTSDGDGTTGLPQSALDLEAALTFIDAESRFDSLPRLLYGHSWGGFAVGAVLDNGHDIAAAVTIAGFDSPGAEMRSGLREEMGAAGVLLYFQAWLDDRIRCGFGAAQQSASEAISAVDTPVLVIHSPDDAVVPYDEVSILSHQDRIANPNAEFWTRDRGDARLNGHTSLYQSAAALDYQDQVGAEWAAVKAQYDPDPVPEQVRDTFYAGVDKRLYGQVDEGFMTRVDEFYQAALA
jgi:alpha-beta hydrolase superfamily lysophospholipase